MNESLIEGPLNAVHVELGAAFAPFGGWSMPVKYAGTVGEHTAVREAVGVFDVSHLGKATVSGPGAAAFINRVFTADLEKIRPGKAQYTLCTNETGGVIDDLIVYYVSDEELFLVPNAANTAAVVEHLVARAPEGITVTDQHRDYAVLAVQGPRSAEVLTALGLPTEMEYMAYEDATLTTASGPVTVRVCRTGYTGEHGYELIPAWSDAEAVFRTLLPEITSRDGQPAGLGARDTLRTEMGYALHGHELSLDITPVQARAGWAVGWKKPEFVGRDVLLAEKEAGPARRLWGLRATGKGVLRPELDVIDAAGARIGFTTSGTFSPTLKVGIALALIDTVAGVQKGDLVAVDVRGRSIECEVTLPPFVDANTK